MGRGGKKKNKKDDQGEGSESTPSTSQDKPVTETTEALTTLSLSESKQAASKKPETDDPKTKQEQTKPPADDDDDDGGGLGLGSSKPRKKRKPKGAATAQSQAPVQPQERPQQIPGPQPTSPSGFPQIPTGPQRSDFPQIPTGPAQYAFPQSPPGSQYPAQRQPQGVQQLPLGVQQLHPGVQQQHPGFQQQHPGFQQQHPGFQQQHPGFQQQHPGFQQQHPGFQQLHPGFQQLHPGVQQLPPGFQQLPPGRQQLPPGVQKLPPGVQQLPPGVQQLPPGVQQLPPGVQQRPPGAQQLPPGIRQQHPGSPQGRGRGIARGSTQGAGGSPFPQVGAGPATVSDPNLQYPRQPQTFVPEERPKPSERHSESESRKPTQTLCRFKIPDKKLLPDVPARRIKVTVNYLKLKYQDLKIHRYDVAIKPDKPKRMIARVFEHVKAKYFRDYTIAFDQVKNMYTLKLITKSITDVLDTTVEILDDNNAKMNFQVIMKHTGVIDLGTITNYMKSGGSTLELPMEAIQCVDVILQQGTLGNYVKAGRQYFKRPRDPIDLTQGMEMWTGLFQSAIFNSGAYINIDVAHKGFPRRQTLIDAITKDFQLNPTKELEGQRGFLEFKHFLKGLRVTALIGGDSKNGRKREFICNGVVDPPYKLSFDITHETGQVTRCTVDKYFETVKNYRLQYPRLNCLWVGPRDKSIYYPMELLEIVYGQAINKQLSDKQLPIMVREAATHPKIRIQKIHEVIQSMRYSTSPQFKNFGLDISDKLTTIDAKVLKVPRLSVGPGNRFAEPRKGSWQAQGLLQAQALQKWAIMLVDGNPNYCQIAPVIELLMNVGRRMGMQIEKPMVVRENVAMRDLRATLMDMVHKGVNFVVVVITTRDKDAYHKVKRAAELEVGVLTQCIKEFTANRKMNEQTMRNILLKINSKLMGVNQALDVACMPKCLQGGNVMLVGADVTHPSPDQSNVPSIAAVTASIDSKYFIYNIELSVQTPKKEMIVQFEDMMVDHFKVYQKHNSGKLPTRIYVLRDGVSDGQFAEVMNSELVALQKAYLRMAGPAARKPEILFVLVQKRHHTRLFTTDCENVEPGTVVDTDIVHQRELNFFLVSHQAIKGTARPTRYHCVCNDSNLSVGEVEQLAFYLCHLYSRCTRSVSYPTPTYYAHLACFRARSLTFGDRFDNIDLERNPKRIHVMDKMLQFSRMFFV